MVARIIAHARAENIINPLPIIVRDVLILIISLNTSWHKNCYQDILNFCQFFYNQQYVANACKHSLISASVLSHALPMITKQQHQNSDTLR